MLTNQTLLTKWSLYTLALLGLIAVQQLLLDHLTLLGVTPFLLPMIVAVVASMEKSIPAALFGLAVGWLCDISGGGVFSGIYTFSFFCIALSIAVISKYWVRRSAVGSVIYAVLAFLVLDAFQLLFLCIFKGAALSAVADIALREILVSCLFVIPIFYLYSFLHRLFRYEEPRSFL